MIDTLTEKRLADSEKKLDKITTVLTETNTISSAQADSEVERKAGKELNADLKKEVARLRQGKIS